MHHGTIARDLARGLRVLRQRIDAATVPASKLDQTLNLATWNVRELGKSPRLPESIHYIAEILGQFDVIALTQLRAETGDLERVDDQVALAEQEAVVGVEASGERGLEARRQASGQPRVIPL